MNNHLRVLVAHKVSCQQPGGMNRIMRLVHDCMAERGDEIEYLCTEDVPNWTRGRWGRFAFPWAVKKRIQHALREGRPYDIVNVHEPAGAVVTSLRGPAPRPKIVVTSHGLERRAWECALEEARLGRVGPTLKTRILTPLITLSQSDLALRRADHVFCLSLDDRQYLSERYRIPETRLTRIYPGASLVFSEVSANRDYGNARRVLFAGTWRKNKGIEDLVPAFVNLASRYADISLVILGGGASADLILNAFPEDLRRNVTSVQTRSEVETANYFAAADLFLLPSLFEGTPLTLIEAMMSGLPIVTTATCGMKDVIRSEENGLLVNVRSPQEIVTAMVRLLDDQSLRARIGLTARHEAVERYTWELVARPVREAYTRLSRLL